MGPDCEQQSRPRGGGCIGYGLPLGIGIVVPLGGVPGELLLGDLAPLLESDACPGISVAGVGAFSVLGGVEVLLPGGWVPLPALGFGPVGSELPGFGVVLPAGRGFESIPGLPGPVLTPLPLPLPQPAARALTSASEAARAESFFIMRITP
jgi:hypothetical protein